MTSNRRSPADVDRTRLLAAVESQRLRLADHLDGPEPAEWEVASLCPESTVHEVLAHLTAATRPQSAGSSRRMWGLAGSVDEVAAR